MRIPEGARKTAAVVTAAVLVFAFYSSTARPWMLRWGATDLEVSESLPGDDAAPGDLPQTTRAVTIAAPVEAVWPWLAQLGQDRAGFYSYEILEDLVGCEMPRATRVVPEFQAWRTGDQLWMYPPEKLDGLGGAPLVDYEAGRHLVFATRRPGNDRPAAADGLWGFHLDPVGERTTRFVVRGRGDLGGGAVAAAVYRGLYEPVHYVMERRMMLGIKAMAEGGRSTRLSENVAVAMWGMTIALLVAALVEVVRRRRWWRPLAVAVAATLVFQVLTLLQPAALVGIPLVVALALGLWWRPAPPARPEPLPSAEIRPVRMAVT